LTFVPRLNILQDGKRQGISPITTVLNVKMPGNGCKKDKQLSSVSRAGPHRSFALRQQPKHCLLRSAGCFIARQPNRLPVITVATGNRENLITKRPCVAEVKSK